MKIFWLSLLLTFLFGTQVSFGQTIFEVIQDSCELYKSTLINDTCTCECAFKLDSNEGQFSPFFLTQHEREQFFGSQSYTSEVLDSLTWAFSYYETDNAYKTQIDIGFSPDSLFGNCVFTVAVSSLYRGYVQVAISKFPRKLEFDTDEYSEDFITLTFRMQDDEIMSVSKTNFTVTSTICDY